MEPTSFENAAPRQNIVTLASLNLASISAAQRTHFYSRTSRRFYLKHCIEMGLQCKPTVREKRWSRCTDFVSNVRLRAYERLQKILRTWEISFGEPFGKRFFFFGLRRLAFSTKDNLEKCYHRKIKRTFIIVQCISWRTVFQEKMTPAVQGTIIDIYLFAVSRNRTNPWIFQWKFCLQLKWSVPYASCSFCERAQTMRR